MNTKKRVSLEAQMREDISAVAPAAPGDVVPMPAPAPAKPSDVKMTVYVPAAAKKRILQMAIEADGKRANDFLREGVDLMLERYGQPSLKDLAGN